MALTKKETRDLFRLIGLTREEEIDCDECLALVAEFVELELASKSIPDGLDAVRHHLKVCAECREEYRALQRALREMEA